MMKQVFAAIFAAFLLTPAWSASLYRAVLHVVSPDGKYQKHPLKETADGVTQVECELRRENWIKEFGPAFESAQKQLKDSGSKPSSYRVECERIGK